MDIFEYIQTKWCRYVPPVEEAVAPARKMEDIVHDARAARRSHIETQNGVHATLIRDVFLAFFYEIPFGALGAPSKTRLEPSIKKLNPCFDHDCVSSS